MSPRLGACYISNAGRGSRSTGKYKVGTSKYIHITNLKLQVFAK